MRLKRPSQQSATRAVRVFISCLVCGAFLTAPVSAADSVVVSVTNPQLENFTNGGAVGLYFNATDLRGQPIGQLTPEHVTVQEDGQDAQIIDFRGEEQGRPVDIVVVFDVTESMGPFIDGMKEAAIDFADRLAKANRDYRLGLVTFEDYVIRDEREFTRSAREFKSWIGALRPAGGGDIPENSLDAMLLASRFPFRPEAQAVLILITDAPNHTRGDGSEKTNPYGREVTQLSGAEVLAEIKKANLNVYAISPPPFMAPDLQRIAKESAGRHYNIVSEGERFPELIGEIGRSLASQYFLTYTSPRPVEDGAEREVVLTLQHPNGEGEARVSYQVRGIGGARVVSSSSGPGGTQPQTVLAYGVWNMLVPLLAAGGLLLLARVRLNEIPAEVLSLMKTATAAPGSTSENPALAPVVPKNSAPYARLVRQSPFEEVPREIAFSRDEMTLGRGEECEAILLHSSISREHARIKKVKQGYVLLDLQSRNGVHINGKKVAENLLRDGMQVRIGDVEFIFYAAST